MTKRSSSLSLSGNHIPTLMHYQLVISHPYNKSYNDLSLWYEIDTIQYFWDNQHRGMNIRNYYLFWQKLRRFWLKPKLLLGIGRGNLSRFFFHERMWWYCNPKSDGEWGMNIELYNHMNIRLPDSWVWIAGCWCFDPFSVLFVFFVVLQYCSSISYNIPILSLYHDGWTHTQWQNMH